MGGAAIDASLDSGQLIPEDVLAIVCVYAEARSEPLEGQIAVASVIRNRTETRFFSTGSVVSTVAWPYQFSWMNTNDGQRSHCLSCRHEEPAVQMARTAWFASEHQRPVGDAVFYHSDAVAPYWAKAQGIEFVTRIGRHLFYRRAGK